MNSENPDTNNVVVPEASEEVKEESSALPIVDPTASFQTIDPTATEELTTVEQTVETEPVIEVKEEPSTEVETLTPQEETTTTTPVAPVQTGVPRVNPVHMDSAADITTRYNPVTGEEMDMKQLINNGKVVEEDAVNNDEKLKKVEVEYKPTSTGNTVMLVIFFIALILFVVFLPDIQTLIALRKEEPTEEKEIMTGNLVCTLESNTVNLDRTFTRVFSYTDKKLQSAKFTTVIRGSSTLDAEALDEINNQCKQIHDNVEEMNGVTVTCNYEEGKVTEKESFDYTLYDIEAVSAAYIEAGGSVVEFQQDQDIDSVMTLMRQSGFTCNKEVAEEK